MSIKNLISSLWSKSAPGGDVTECPQELDLLAYINGKLSDRKSEQLESHFVGCDDCRESLTFFAKVSSDTTALEPVTSQEIKEQTASVIALIKQSEFSQRQSQQVTPNRQKVTTFWQLGAAAIATFTIIITAGIWYLYLPSDAEKARDSIALAMKDERLVEPRLSGNLVWSKYSTTRGPGEPLKEEARLNLERARNLVSDSDDSSLEDRIELARSYLASGKKDDAKHALDILGELEARGKLTAEAINDLGVALFELENYDQAINYFSKALESRPDFNEALFNRALAASKAERYDQSRQDWKEFIDRSSDPDWKQEAAGRLKDLDSSR